MAKQHLEFSIGSTFSGEGFKAAQKGVSTLNDRVNEGSRIVGQLTSAMGSMDGTVGKAARAMTGMLNTIMSLNPVLIVVTGAITALTFAYNSWKEKQEEAKKAAEELIKTQTALVDKIDSRIVAKAVSDMANISREFESITKHANDMAAAIAGLNKERAQGGIIAIQAEKVQAAMKEVSEEARRMVEAEYDYKIAIAKAAASRQSAETELRTAHQAVIDNENRVAVINEQRATLLTQIKRLEGNIAYAKKHNLENIEKEEEKLSTLRNKLIELADKEADLKGQISVALAKEQTATEKLTNAEIAAKTEVDAAALQISVLKQKSEEDAKKLEEETRKREERIAQEKEHKQLREEAAQIQKDVNESAKKVAEAERAYAAALAEYERNYADNEIANDIFNPKRDKGLSVPVRIDGTVKADIVSHDLKDAINNGLIKSVRDMDKFARDRAREVDKNEKKNWHQLEQEAQRYERLQSQGRKSWSKADKDFAEKFETLKEAAEAKKREVQEAKQRLQLEWQRELENYNNLAAIKKKLEKLGLK